MPILWSILNGRKTSYLSTTSCGCVCVLMLAKLVVETPNPPQQNQQNRKRMRTTNAMPTFRSHLTFLHFRQPLGAGLAARTRLAAAHHVHQAAALLVLLRCLHMPRRIKNTHLITQCECLTRALHCSSRYMNHVVTRFSGDGAVVVRCMFRISLDRPNFHSMSDWAWVALCPRLRVRRARLGKWDKITSVVAIRWANVCLPEPGGLRGTHSPNERRVWCVFEGRGHCLEDGTGGHVLSGCD